MSGSKLSAPTPTAHHPTKTANDTLALWNRNKDPDPRYIKPFNRGGFRGTSTNVTALMLMFTKEFGPVGTGWGWIVDHENYVPGHVDGPNQHIIHVVRGRVWYRGNDGQQYYTGEQFGQTEFVGKNKNGWFTDEEAPKKSISDMISKCAASLGFAAAIHLGAWDDNKYVNDVKQRYAKAEAEGKKQAAKEENPDAAQRALADYSTFIGNLAAEHRNLANLGPSPDTNRKAQELRTRLKSDLPTWKPHLTADQVKGMQMNWKAYTDLLTKLRQDVAA